MSTAIETGEIVEVSLIKSFGITHAIAICLDCKWQSQNYKNAQANAARHAKCKHHCVSVEIGISGTYNGRNGINSSRPAGADHAD